MMTLQTARIGKNNRAQIVTIPLEFRFPQGMKDVYIRKVGHDVILSPRPDSWQSFLDSKVCAMDDLRGGQQLGANDLMIAAHARSINAVIVTNNMEDFGRVRDLKLENWMA